MSILIKGMEMPKNCEVCPLNFYECALLEKSSEEIMKYFGGDSRHPDCPLIEVPPHGDLIDRDALIKDGWLSLYKEVMRMGGYAIHELPLKNPSIPVIIPAGEDE